MIPLYGGTTALCSTLSPERLEATFFFPAARYDRAPSPAAQAAWDEAKEMCLDCPFMLRCEAEHKGDEWGVWGGTDPYERYMERRRRSKRHQRASADAQAAEAARVYALYAGHRGLPVSEVALRTGYSTKTVNAMIEAHEAALRAARAEPSTAGPEPAQLPTPRRPVVWPVGDPQGSHGWTWSEARPVPMFYVGQTPEADWYYVKLTDQTVRCWVPADLVDLRSSVTVNIMARGTQHAA